MSSRMNPSTSCFIIPSNCVTSLESSLTLTWSTHKAVSYPLKRKRFVFVRMKDRASHGTCRSERSPSLNAGCVWRLWKLTSRSECLTEAGPHPTVETLSSSRSPPPSCNRWKWRWVRRLTYTKAERSKLGVGSLGLCRGDDRLRKPLDSGGCLWSLFCVAPHYRDGLSQHGRILALDELIFAGRVIIVTAVFIGFVSSGFTLLQPWQRHTENTPRLVWRNFFRSLQSTNKIKNSFLTVKTKLLQKGKEKQTCTFS